MLFALSLRRHRPTSPFCFKYLSSNLRFAQSAAGHQFIPYQVNETTAFEFDAVTIAMQKRRKLQAAAANKRQKLYSNFHEREGSNEEVLDLEVHELLREAALENSNDLPSQPIESGVPSKPAAELADELGKEAEFEVVKLSSTGDGLAYSSKKDQVIVIPFTLPGDIVLAKPYKWLGFHSLADFVKVIKPSPLREDVTPKCKHFGTCSGCQLQMMGYDDQLEHKRGIVERAFKNFSGLDPTQIPQVGKTMPSPRTYGYRTKLTPHYQGPLKYKVAKEGLKAPPITGFNQKGNSHKIVDIESCPISSDIVQAGLTFERAKLASNFSSIKSGATLLIRENTHREFRTDVSHFPYLNGGSKPATSAVDEPNRPESTTTSISSTGEPYVKTVYPTWIDTKTYTSDNNSLVTEHVGDFRFVNRAGGFFQNNNSILQPFTAYVHSLCAAPQPILDPAKPAPPIKYLLDAYCGSGLFAITLSGLFSSALGIDVDARSIEQARQNASINQLENIGFIDADAADLFADVPFPPEQTLTIIDPPRRGASEDFLRQLCAFGPKRVVYVSCNVHSQARDIGMLVNGFAKTQRGQSDDERKSYWSYDIESLRGADFFPQTGHVEGVAVLNRVEKRGPKIQFH